jgi:hypothetical protein
MDFFFVVFSPWFYGWLIGLFVVWACLCCLFRRTECFKAKPISAAHQVVVLVPFTFLAIFGSMLWFFDEDFASAFKDDKIFGDYGPAVSLVIVMLAFQIWDVCATAYMAISKEVKDQTQHIIHHASTVFLVTIALLSSDKGFCIYYGAFFFGVSEVSSIPLAIMDLFKYSDQLRDTFPAISEGNRVFFAVLFLAIRCVYWPIVSLDFWIACLASDAELWFNSSGTSSVSRLRYCSSIGALWSSRESSESYQETRKQGRWLSLCSRRSKFKEVAMRCK